MWEVRDASQGFAGRVCHRSCTQRWPRWRRPVPRPGHGAADVAVVCLESVEDERERRHLAAKLGKTHTVVDITRAQVRAAHAAGGGRRPPGRPPALWLPSPLCAPVFPVPTSATTSPSMTHTPAVPLTPQMAALCGNVLELEDGRGLPVLAMSTQAYNAFTDDQKRVLRWAPRLCCLRCRLLACTGLQEGSRQALKARPPRPAGATWRHCTTRPSIRW